MSASSIQKGARTTGSKRVESKKNSLDREGESARNGGGVGSKEEGPSIRLIVWS